MHDGAMGGDRKGEEVERERAGDDRRSHGSRSMLSSASQARSCQSGSAASAFASLSGLSNGELFRRLTMSSGSSRLSRSSLSSRTSHPASSLSFSSPSSRPITASSTFSASDDFEDAELELWLRMKHLKRFAPGLKSVGVTLLDDVAKLATAELEVVGTNFGWTLDEVVYLAEQVRDLSTKRLVRKRGDWMQESHHGEPAIREQSSPQILELETEEGSRPGTRFIPLRQGSHCPRLRLPRTKVAEPRQRSERQVSPLQPKDQLTHRSQEDCTSQAQAQATSSSKSRRLQKLKDLNDAKVNKEIRDWAKRCQRALL